MARTPEQLSQNTLNQQMLQNEMNLLNTSKSNDLALYKKFQTKDAQIKISILTTKTFPVK